VQPHGLRQPKPSLAVGDEPGTRHREAGELAGREVFDPSGNWKRLALEDLPVRVEALHDEIPVDHGEQEAARGAAGF
jgi:hypothetical protein